MLNITGKGEVLQQDSIMEGSSLQKVLFLLIAGVVLLCQLCQALPVVTEVSTMIKS